MLTNLRRSLACGLLCVLGFSAASPAAETAAAAQAPVYGQWQHCGWGGGGFFFPSVFHPTDPHIIFLGGDVAGVYRTDDQGKQWRFINNGVGHYPSYALAIARNAPDTLYLMAIGGMYKTIDGGKHWKSLPQTLAGQLDIQPDRGGTLKGVAVDPANADIVFVADKKGRLFRSGDGGENWKELDYLPKETEMAAAEVKQPDTVTFLADWEEKDNTAGWAAHKRDKKYLLAKSVAQSDKTAFTGKGSLALHVSAAGGDFGAFGRAEIIFGKGQSGENWSAYKKISARFHVPEGKPALQEQLVVQTGEKWGWFNSNFVDGKPGDWTEVSLDLTKVKDLDAVRALYFVVRTPQSAYDGEVYLDAVALHTDAGASVERSNTKVVSGPGMVSSVIVSPHDSRIVFACSSKHGLLRSSDGGATWAKLGTPPCSSLAISSRDALQLLGAFGSKGVMLSGDGGNTWKPLPSLKLPDGAGIREVAIHAQKPNVFYAYSKRGWSGVFFRSSNAGKTWTSVSSGTPDFSGNPTLPDGDHNFSTISGMTVSPANSDLIFLSGNWRNWLSTDGGITFRESDRGADMSCIHDIRFHNGRTYAVAMDEGLLASDDNGANWTQLFPRKHTNGRSGHQWRVNISGPAGSERIVSTLSPWENDQPNGALVSEDGGRKFTFSRTGLPAYVSTVNCMWGRAFARALASDPKDPSTLYLGIDGDPDPAKKQAGGGVFKSTDGGKSWTQLANQPASRRMFYGLAVDPTNSRRLYWGACDKGGGVYRSENSGESWELVFGKNDYIFNLAIDSKGNVYAGNQQLFRSSDHGKTWTKVSNFADTRNAIVGMEIDPANENRIWISKVAWGSGNQGGVFRTTDGGATWEEITGELPYRKPLILRYNPQTHELWAGGVGLFKIKQ